MATAASTASSTTSPPHTTTMSTHSTELVKGSHEFTVAGYSLQKRNGAGHRISSGSFEVGGYSWAVRFYPAGSTKDQEEGHVSVFLELGSTVVEKVTARFRFRVNGATASSWGQFNDFTLISKTWGYQKFMEIETVESEYLINDCLTMHCDVEVVKELKTGATMSRFITVPPPAICCHLEQLLESKEGCDVTFQVERSDYDAHRVVLSARSPVFRAQFFGPMADTGGGGRYVRILDMKPTVFEAVLRFIYTDRLPPVEDGEAAASSCWREDVREMARS
uniref:BTB domain-containing protein n=2 Tax=Oryza TaxID=4527 RepID=A0A0D3H038_9ORYZ